MTATILEHIFARLGLTYDRLWATPMPWDSDCLCLSESGEKLFYVDGPEEEQ